MSWEDHATPSERAFTRRAREEWKNSSKISNLFWSATAILVYSFPLWITALFLPCDCKKKSDEKIKPDTTTAAPLPTAKEKSAISYDTLKMAGYTFIEELDKTAARAQSIQKK